ncbi:MgtC/SapB family protein [Roseococcus pinisoli]|uniref:Protein MgtC n=1 Tax=Roseococcus pinisoli TaxID=2835040 RepID=A0ABS5QBJ5_9PROT|nr:MgtC/SapB family protein [Roseococcus pinisoli]MBS7810307.1 MgtC/SapB family protein [Roseococcus pinisoli]
MIPPLLETALNLGTATLLGAAIGFERQWHQRLAGLRTNTLVAIGAASFVVFSSLAGPDASPTRVAAQVVSGIGFLGAGVIFKEGANVRGLNTAATLWCSAAVGLLAGMGAHLHAALVAGFIVLVNLFLRPLVRMVNRQPLLAASTAGAAPACYTVEVVCRGAEEARVRAMLLQGLGGRGLHLRRLESSNIEDTDRVEVHAVLGSDSRQDEALEQIVGRLSLDPMVTAARWRTDTLAE